MFSVLEADEHCNELQLNKIKMNEEVVLLCSRVGICKHGAVFHGFNPQENKKF